MNLILTADEKVVRRARKAAGAMGMSLNQAVRRFLDELAGEDSAERDVEALRALSKRSAGRSRGWRFNLDEIHARS
jgi:antitoxin component of RelBE/YafQ-DinJ toxin-antitoxin module